MDLGVRSFGGRKGSQILVMSVTEVFDKIQILNYPLL